MSPVRTSFERQPPSHPGLEHARVYATRIAPKMARSSRWTNNEVPLLAQTPGAGRQRPVRRGFWRARAPAARRARRMAGGGRMRELRHGRAMKRGGPGVMHRVERCARRRARMLLREVESTRRAARATRTPGCVASSSCPRVLVPLSYAPLQLAKTLAVSRGLRSSRSPSCGPSHDLADRNGGCFQGEKSYDGASSARASRCSRVKVLHGARVMRLALLSKW
jgi:hypothetical protein